jgi:phosphohistidine phosphatase
MAPKRLALMRHAKSSWDDDELDDHERPLAPRGRRAAKRMRDHLRDIDAIPDVVLCSSALRTRQTLDLLDLSARSPVLFEDGLYGASAAELLSRVHRVDDAVGTALIIGHNPGIAELTVLLTADDGGPWVAFPTAAVAVLRCSIASWAELRPGVADLERFATPAALD